MKINLKGYRALVTGASSGIGEAFALQLAALGADLVITARRKSKLLQFASELQDRYGVKVECIALDLARPESAGLLFQEATANGKVVNILINNAGIGPYSKFLKSPLEAHLSTIQLNSTTVTELCFRFSSHMIAQGKTCYIANIASIAAFQGAPNFATYAGTKVYNRIFSEILNRELRGTNVSITCICPGGTYTEFLEKNGQVLTEAGRSTMMTAHDVARMGLRGMFQRKAVVVPGWLNKIACFLPRLLPRGLALTLAEIMMNRSVSKLELETQGQLPPA
ncbi:MAG: SDR family oxidoreductase [Bdellovibrionia bacterium]